MTSSEIAAALGRFSATTVHEAMGRRGSVDPAVCQRVAGTRVCAPALTVQCHVGDNLALHHALSLVKPGQVIVVDASGAAWGYWGEIMARAAIHRGVAGLVIDGGVRDLDGLRELRFPVWARHVSMRGTVKATPGHVSGTITCGGVTVSPGDIVVADADGVVVVPLSEVSQVSARCQQIEAKEDAMRRRLGEGATTLELLGLPPYPSRHEASHGQEGTR